MGSHGISIQGSAISSSVISSTLEIDTGRDISFGKRISIEEQFQIATVGVKYRSITLTRVYSLSSASLGKSAYENIVPKLSICAGMKEGITVAFIIKSSSR